MKKRLSVVFIIIVLLFVNLISSVSYALEPDWEPPFKKEDLTNKNDNEDSKIVGNFKDIFKELENRKSKAEINGQKIGIEIDQDKHGTIISGVQSALITILEFIPNAANEVLTNTLEYAENKSELNNFSIYKTVTGYYALFNFNFLDTNFGSDNSFGNIIQKLSGDEDSSESESENEERNESEFIRGIKNSTQNAYFIMRNLSIAISLFVLLYVGIRMLTSTVASTKAKYKKMLTDWVVSLLLILVLHLIIFLLSYISEVGLNILRNFGNSLNIDKIETGITNGVMTDLSGKSGMNVVMACITAFYLVWIEIKFFIMYTRRMCEITFLTIISPLITITYAIDKVGDGKAQAFNNWIKELIIKVSIQWVHAITYILFMLTAAAIAQKAPLIALLFFSGLSRGEKIVRNLLDVKERSFDDEKVPFIE